MQYSTETLHAYQEIIDQLNQPQASISPKYFYDTLGCRLFELITALPEYYPTRTERALMTEHAGAIAAAVGQGGTLIDLGAGNCEKAAALFDSLRPHQYVALDISAEFLQTAVAALRQKFPAIEMSAVGADLSGDFELPAAVSRQARTFFYPGSSIGNFDPPEALALLSRIRHLCHQPGGLLIGIDLVKDSATLEAAYDDELGVTAAFNLNVLNHLNSLIESDFQPREWRHRARYASARSRIEMYLEASRDLTVNWAGGEREFKAGERIHTESSYKYRLGEFEALLQRAGFSQVQSWTDARQWFAVCYASL